MNDELTELRTKLEAAERLIADLHARLESRNLDRDLDRVQRAAEWAGVHVDFACELWRTLGALGHRPAWEAVRAEEHRRPSGRVIYHHRLEVRVDRTTVQIWSMLAFGDPPEVSLRVGDDLVVDRQVMSVDAVVAFLKEQR